MNKIRIAALDRRDARERSLATSIGPSLQERQSALIGFYQEYEELVETLCDAANYGPNAGLSAKYARLQSWMQENYPSIRRFISAYVKLEIEDAEQGGDAFEALFTAKDLATFLQSDDGNMITRIMRTRDALNLYGDHLRQLAAAA